MFLPVRVDDAAAASWACPDCCARSQSVLRDRRRVSRELLKIFYVNWFRKSPDGKFLWPGFGENSRVLEWVFERVNGRGEAVETPIGLLPSRAALPLDGLELPEGALDELLRVDVEEWRNELPSIEEHFAQFGDHLPPALRDELEALEKRLSS